jgi:hypothetical protein
MQWMSVNFGVLYWTKFLTRIELKKWPDKPLLCNLATQNQWHELILFQAIRDLIFTGAIFEIENRSKA